MKNITLVSNILHLWHKEDKEMKKKKVHSFSFENLVDYVMKNGKVETV